MSRQRPALLGTAIAAPLLLLTAPGPATAVRQLGEPGPLPDQTAPLVALLALAAWALTGWLLVALLVTAGAHLPGVAGRVLAASARRLAPAVVRRAVEVALGLGVAVGASGVPAAGADPAPAAASVRLAVAPAVDPDSVPALPSLDWPVAAGAGGGVPGARRPAGAITHRKAPVVVRPGDSLWRLAERDLLARSAATRSAATRSAAAPTAREVARAWPAWWVANRDVIGDDPHLIHPGTRLRPPASP